MTSCLPMHSDTKSSQQGELKGALELCLHVSSQRQSIVDEAELIECGGP